MSKLLLDTHALLWWIEDVSRLGAEARKAISSSRNEVYISVVNAWEIAIKAKLGKLILTDTPRQLIGKIRADNDFSMLAIEAEHAAAVFDLPLLHNDPFDRLLLAQAKSEKMTLITDDANLGRYGVQLKW